MIAPTPSAHERILPARVIPVLLFFLGLAALGLLAARPHTSAATAVAPASTGHLPIDASTSLLVVSPHPDDETLCCAGAIQAVRQAGGHVAVVWMTSGDGSDLDMLVVERSLLETRAKVRDLALRRMQEARTATGLLGVPEDRQFFLGYPDGGLTQLLTDHRTSPYRARLTGAQQVPYAQALFPGHPYTGDSLEKDFAAVLEKVHPTLVLAPSPQDTHPDHRATGLLAIDVLRQRGSASIARYWIVHGGEGWPRPRGLAEGLPLPPSPRGIGLDAVSLALPSDAQARKLAAIKAYRTQMQVMPAFLLAFARSSEIYYLQPVPPALASRGAPQRAR